MSKTNQDSNSSLSSKLTADQEKGPRLGAAKPENGENQMDRKARLLYVLNLLKHTAGI